VCFAAPKHDSTPPGGFPGRRSGNSTLPASLVEVVRPAQLRAHLRSGGPLLVLFFQQRCPLSCAFWPIFLRVASTYPHIRSLALDVEFEWSLSAQLGIGGVPTVVLMPSSHGVVPRVFAVDLDLTGATDRLASFTHVHTGHLPEPMPEDITAPCGCGCSSRSRGLNGVRTTTSYDPCCVAAGAYHAIEESADKSCEPGGLQGDHGRRGVNTGRVRDPLSFTLADSFPGPEDATIDWRQWASVAVLAAWAMQWMWTVCMRLLPRVQRLASHFTVPTSPRSQE